MTNAEESVASPAGTARHTRLTSVLLQNYAYVFVVQAFVAALIEFTMAYPPFDFMPHPSCPEGPECEAAWESHVSGLRRYGYGPLFVVWFFASVGWQLRQSPGWLRAIPVSLLNFLFCTFWVVLLRRAPNDVAIALYLILLGPVVGLTCEIVWMLRPRGLARRPP